VLDVVKKEFPDMFELMRYLYYLKYDEDAYVIFIRNGYSSGYLGQLSLEELHQLCIDFKIQLHNRIEYMVTTGFVSNEEASWISKNMAAYCGLQAYRELVKDV
jgi:hypothetical protein